MKRQEANCALPKLELCFRSASRVILARFQTRAHSHSAERGVTVSRENSLTRRELSYVALREGVQRRGGIDGRPSPSPSPFANAKTLTGEFSIGRRWKRTIARAVPAGAGNRNGTERSLHEWLLTSRAEHSLTLALLSHHLSLPRYVPYGIATIAAESRNLARCTLRGSTFTLDAISRPLRGAACECDSESLQKSMRIYVYMFVDTCNLQMTIVESIATLPYRFNHFESCDRYEQIDSPVARVVWIGGILLLQETVFLSTRGKARFIIANERGARCGSLGSSRARDSSTSAAGRVELEITLAESRGENGRISLVVASDASETDEPKKRRTGKK